nr:tRNA lysidine(34) synthetase TilS [Novosphingobium lentum]
MAVSGGADSLALLALAHAALPGGFAVATVDHGLRDGSAADARLVERACAARSIACSTLRLALEPGSAVQERARTARYTALADWALARGLRAIATAHHADDQAETMAMRLNRGAGVRGLAGMRARSQVPGAPQLPLLRPLLGWRRAELAEAIAATGLVAANDPSNRDPRFERVRIRHGLAASDWLDPAGLARSAAHLADADEAIAWAATREWAERVEGGPGDLTWAPQAPRAVRLRVLARIVVELGTSEPRGAELARWLAALESGAVATLAGVRGDGEKVPWRFVTAAPHRHGPAPS